MVIENVNINFKSNKRGNLKLIIQGKVEVLVITETKTAKINLQFKAIQNLTDLKEIGTEVLFLHMCKKILQVRN